MEHTSTVLEPSIPFHTLVRLVEAEDIADDKIRTHDLTLELNKITKQFQTKILDSPQNNQLMLTQPFGPPSRPKGSRYSRPRSNSNTKKQIQHN